MNHPMDSYVSTLHYVFILSYSPMWDRMYNPMCSLYTMCPSYPHHIYLWEYRIILCSAVNFDGSLGHPSNRLYLKKSAGMHWSGCNDAVP